MNENQVVSTSVGQLSVRLLGSGHPAVLWHSLFVDERSWGRMVPELQAHRRLVVITGPGHGDSTDPGRRYSNEECAEAAVEVLDALGIEEPVDWVGNAWGGHVGITLAATRPDRCRSLVALGTPVAALTPQERTRTWLLLGVYSLLGPTTMVVDGVINTLLSEHTRSHDPEAVELVRECLLTANRRRLSNAVVSVSLRRSDLAGELDRLTQPTLIVTAADHAGFTPDQARAVGRRVRDCRVGIVPDAAYLVPLEAPQVTASQVLEFWDALDQRREAA
ncbi:Pimeloyl-ACP methyl ester carboxylesterase [Raineyella antarctica]|uniref:Pimeloyl-ACP methyl ester carboxylesterase n=2 Tax=Raineyella antarctica TaxID=1577474 RepID=A0A1G6GDJ5_9ACTN|nr:Pimeloyl-ACP methyl ester carboxylesterase [Raineyella antarctica]